MPTYGEASCCAKVLERRKSSVSVGRYIIRVGWDDVRGWMDQGGTLIGTARSRLSEPRRSCAAAYNLIINGIDASAVCGGDGSLTGADKLRAEWPDLVAALKSKGRITEEQANKFAT